MATISWGPGGGGESKQPRSLLWRLTMLAVIVAGLVLTYFCSGPVPH